MTTQSDWEAVYICPCGRRFFPNSLFGRDWDYAEIFVYHTICPQCGGDLGINGTLKAELMAIRFTLDPRYRWWKPWTWKVPNRSELLNPAVVEGGDNQPT